MLTFYYGNYKVHIDHTGKAEYFRVDDQYRYARVEGKGWVATCTPGAEIILMAGQMLQIVMTETTKAKMRVAQLAQELQSTKAALERAEDMQRAGEEAISDCTIEVTLASERLKAAGGTLQSARVQAGGRVSFI